MEAVVDALLQPGEAALVGGAHEEQPGGALGHDVRRLAAVGDDAVDALGGADVLAQLRDRLVGGDQPVERVDAGVRRRRGVRGAAAVLDLDWR